MNELNNSSVSIKDFEDARSLQLTQNINSSGSSCIDIRQLLSRSDQESLIKIMKEFKQKIKT
ncbi:hypothetical protein HON22_02510 [Candidatus Peregrinibacteria bacterium]|jgi:hypothetical protein|nr:hypothetical protein [Candidatus Peregrinibacteria bacterium]